MPIYKLKNDKGYRVEVNYTDSFGNRKKIVKQNKNTLTLRDAKQIEAELTRKISTLTGTCNEIILNDLYDFYTKTKANEIKLSTIQSNDRRYKRYIKPYFGKQKIADISKIDFQNWKNEIIKLNLSIKYMNHLYTLFSGILNFAIRYDYLEVNNLKKIGGFKNSSFATKKINPKTDIWKKEEFDKFIKVARDNCIKYEQNGNGDYLLHWAYYVMFNIMFYCGCRRGEVYPLNWNDIDFNTNILSITKGLTYKVKGAKDNYIISTPKTKSSIRNITMPMQLVKVLKEHKERYKKVYGFDDNFFVCGGYAPIRDGVVDDFKKKCVEESGVKMIKIHGFRHSHASLLINMNANIFLVKERMGHSSIKETIDTYGHLYQETDDEAVSKISSLG